MSHFIDNAVTIEMIAAALESTVDAVETEAATLFGEIGHDWQGRPALSTTDAHTMMASHRDHDQDHAEAWREHVHALQAWESARELVRDAALQHHVDVGTRLGQEATSDGHDAAAEAERGFERLTPRPEFHPTAATPPSKSAERLSATRVDMADSAMERSTHQPRDAESVAKPTAAQR